MMRTRLVLIGLCLLALTMASCGGTGGEAEVTFAFDFEDGEQGWVAGFSDLPSDYDPESYQLESSWEPLPSGLEGHGIYMRGHNHSDDLFMFLKTHVDGLAPETTYQANFSIDLATNMPEGMMGIGGSPGESVFAKAGATAIEPLAEDVDGMLLMNISKGNQASEGADMLTLGHIAHPELDVETAGEVYDIKTLSSEGRPFRVTTDADGRLWLLARNGA